MEERESMGGGGKEKEDRDEVEKGEENQDRAARYHLPWPQVPFNFVL